MERALSSSPNPVSIPPFPCANVFATRHLLVCAGPKGHEVIDSPDPFGICRSSRAVKVPLCQRFAAHTLSRCHPPTMTRNPPYAIRFMSNGISIDWTAVLEISFMTFALTRSRCARDLNTI